LRERAVYGSKSMVLEEDRKEKGRRRMSYLIVFFRERSKHTNGKHNNNKSSECRIEKSK